MIPVEYTRRGYTVQNDFNQYGDYRNRDEFYNIANQKLQAEVNAHLYSVSQRLPQLSTYSPINRHSSTNNVWDKASDVKHVDSKESNSSDSLDKSVIGSNMSSCSNQTATSSLAGVSSYTTSTTTEHSNLSPPLVGPSSAVPQDTTICVYLHTHKCIKINLAIEDYYLTSSRLLTIIMHLEELGMSQPGTRTLAASVFAIWMCSPLLEVQLKPQQSPTKIYALWQKLLKKYTYNDPDKIECDKPMIRLQRNVFFPKNLEENIKDSHIQELLYEEARYNVVRGRYPLEKSQAITLGGLQARIQLGTYDQYQHTIIYFRENQEQFLPKHACCTGWRRINTLLGGRKSSVEAKLIEQMQRAPSQLRKARAKYLHYCRSMLVYGASFFQGQIEQPVRSLTSLLLQEDIPVLVAINSNGVYVVDDTQSTMLLGLLYEELSWDYGLPSDPSNEDCLPCVFLQFMVVENGLRVSKILQVFSKQASMMDNLIEYFAGEYRKKIGDDNSRQHCDYHSDSAPISLPPLWRPDSPDRRLATKLARLSLTTHDGRGNLLGGAGNWIENNNNHLPTWQFPHH